jgi:hypothetical protein
MKPYEEALQIQIKFDFTLQGLIATQRICAIC